jgi:ABC-type Fe3+-hydroxamate transport system substrate-binding protein
MSEQQPDNRHLIFTMKNICHTVRSAGWQQVRQLASSHLLLIAVTDGQGLLYTRDVRYSLSVGECFLLTPGMLMKLEAAAVAPFAYYELAFEPAAAAGKLPEADEFAATGGVAEDCVIHIAGKQTGAHHLSVADKRSGNGDISPDDKLSGDRDFSFTFAGKLSGFPALPLLDRLKALHANASAQGLAGLKNHIRFHELLLDLFEHAALENGQHSSIQAVEATIELLHHSYHENLTVELLAAKARLGSWQYRQLFKRLTGHKPNEYISSLRIERAKELLMLGTHSLDEIARSVGYQDSYYFSRKFAQHVGVSPKQYTQTIRSNMRIIALTHFGDLLPLGIKPIAVDKYLLQWLDAEHTSGIESIEHSLAGVDKASRLRPDLILVNPYVDAELVACFQQIAPTLMLETGNSLLHNLRDIADVLGKREEAETWISRYRTKAKQIKSRLQPSIGKQETAVFFHVVEDEIYLCRPQELPVIYEVLGFQPPSALKLLINRQTGRLFVPVSDFPNYAADRIFLATGQMDGAAETLDWLLGNPHWKELPAVLNGRVYQFDANWTLHGAIALDWQLDGITALLQSGIPQA